MVIHFGTVFLEMDLDSTPSLLLCGQCWMMCYLKRGEVVDATIDSDLSLVQLLSYSLPKKAGSIFAGSVDNSSTE